MDGYVIYDPRTGGIHAHIAGAVDDVEREQAYFANSVVLQAEAASPDLQYVDLSGEPTIRDRVAMPVQVIGQSIRNIAAPAEIEVIGPVWVKLKATEGEVEFEFDEPGDYIVNILSDQAEWLPASVTLRV